MIRIACLLTLLLMGSASARSQDDAQQEDSVYEFISGIVVDLPAGRVVVERSVLGKQPERRIFAITGETRVEGQLRAGARVTVSFRTGEDGEVRAVRIIVRSQGQKR